MTQSSASYLRMTKYRQSGFTLFEVMVAVVVLVIGVLGAAAMTITAIRNGQQSGVRSTAVALASEASEIIRGNFTQFSPPTGVLVNTSTSVGIASTSSCFTSGTGCNLAQMAANDLFTWSRKVMDPSTVPGGLPGGLPGGQAVICVDDGNHPSTAADTPAAPLCDNLGTVVVKIWWTDKTITTTPAVIKPNMSVRIQPI